MSLAREKYLKRKRELLENINLIDIGEKKEANLEKKREIKNQDNENKNDKTNKSMSQNVEKKKSDHKKENELKDLKSTSHNYKPLIYTNEDNNDIKNPNKLIKNNINDKIFNNKENTLNRKNIDNLLDNDGNNNLMKDTNINKNINSFSPINYYIHNKESGVNNDNDKKKIVMNNIYELINDLNNIDINNSLILLIYVCKLLLHMCAKSKENQSVMNTSLTSVEMLREIKNRNRKNIKLLKINIINSVLIYLSNKSEEIYENNSKFIGTNNENFNDIYEKHKEIKIEEKCIDIENIGINIIIKVIYIKNIKNLLFKYLYHLNNTCKNANDAKALNNNNMINLSNIKNNDKVKNEEKKIVTPPLNENKDIPIDSSGNNYNSLLQENEKKKKKIKNKGTKGNNESYIGEYNMKNKEDNKNNKINYLENLINEPTAKEKKIKQEKTNILSIIEAPTVIEEMRIKKFQKKDDSVKIICPYLTKKICQKHSKDCNKVHFKKIISEHTDPSLGDCSYLDTCRHIETCKFVHYAVDKDDQIVNNQQNINEEKLSICNINDNTYGPQWIRCDLRNFDLSIFNQYVSVVMADPPWDIHMDLPYGTMTDNEMKHLPVQLIQDEGMIFLWVTGRAMELARECLQIWGYKRVEEILWVKTNHLQRIIRTGRTGHWLNHSKEHCLVGIKGNPVINRNIDCNVIVSEVRETSRKPDEIYSIIERLCPQNLKIELFGRPHNCRNNWITLGNQLNGVVLHHPQIKERYNKVASLFNLPLCEN
ncbi:mRNA (N6-adenosine)-methyltransferase, putative [Plasmodium gallinaceum]|uniref:mRNA (N6-adenosine)-methyltransferase, putative n=1 Tax=Plasmodium gallinaceum TaxID=5849 RepID=A0A1J1GLF7_PLAGA|nr:mRNA (N6-adenosine)-methyltransferase, putative [Plasmodium gallinaceum]CRG93248.1 mRNA (N6-adenosine)-methyltransferase, putative [Plasmodium gallinaceum]